MKIKINFRIWRLLVTGLNQKRYCRVNLLLWSCHFCHLGHDPLNEGKIPISTKSKLRNCLRKQKLHPFL